jgi:DNA-binding HxlR family transcriptional regulator
MADDNACMKSIERVMGIFGGKWSFIIIDELHNGPRRFNQLNKNLNINTKSLTDALKHLEQHNIISRTVYPTVPVTVEYALTERGRAFDCVLDAMKDWSNRWLTAG